MKNIKFEGLKNTRDLGGIKAKNVEAIYIADKDYLQAVFDTIDENWESTDDFVKNGLKLEENMIKRF